MHRRPATSLSLKQTTRLIGTLVLLASSQSVHAQSPSTQTQSSPATAAPQQSTGSGARVVLVPHPDGGMYLGQTELTNDEVNVFEGAVQHNVAIYFPPSLVSGQEELGEMPLTFDVQRAQNLWDSGYLVMGSAWETSPARGQFRVDNLLRGDYDAELHTLAEQFKAFGHPMLFTTAREPNGALNSHFGGFGPQGDKSFKWAADNGKGFADFDVSKFSIPGNPKLLDGLGDPNVCDGIERLAAAQRYYFDFLVRREGINSLTFDTMGWSAGNPNKYFFETPGSHAYRLRASCFDPATFFESIGSQYFDWVSVDLYFGLVPDERPRHPDEPPESIANSIDLMDTLLATVRTVAPGKPVLVAELGFCRPNQRQAVVEALPALMSHPEIKAGLLWGDNLGFPCLIGPSQSNGGPDFAKYMADHPDSFRSCAHFSDGSTTVGCSDTSPRRLASTRGASSSSCISDCLAKGETQAECEAACGSPGAERAPGGSCISDCMAKGESRAECGQACGGSAAGQAWNQPCTTSGGERGKTCDSLANCSSGELVQGCCILGQCSQQ